MILQVGVKVALRNEEGKVLLVKRASEKYGKTDGAWDIVGGRIDPGSSLLDNLKREVAEETKLEITSTPRLIGAQDIIKEGERHVVRLTYVADTVGTPTLDISENVEYIWATVEELSRMDDLDVYVRTLLKENLLNSDCWPKA